MSAPEASGAFDASGAAQALWRDCSIFWHGEEAVVRTYLRAHRSDAADVAWLRLAAYKETRLYRELTDAGRADFDAGRPVEGLDASQRRVLEEEMRHYAAIAALVVERGGRPPAPDEVLDFPADRALQAARARLRRSEDPVARCVSALVEGGGGALYRVLAELGGSRFDRHVAKVFAGILEDELDHGPAQLSRLATTLASPAEATRAADGLAELGRLRLEMRVEMFALPEETAAAIRRSVAKRRRAPAA